MLLPQKHLVWLVNHDSQQRASYAFPCVLSLLVLARFVSGTVASSGLRHVEEAKLTVSLAAGHKSLGVLHPHGIWCPDDCGKTIGTGFLPLCLSGVISGTADFHLWGLDHFFKRSIKTGKSRRIGEQRQRQAKFLQCLFNFDFTALSSLHLWRGKPAERDAAFPCEKQIVRCLHYSWPSPGAGSSDQPDEKHMKAGDPTSVPPQLGELLNSQFYEVEQLSIAYPDKRTFLLKIWINKQVITGAWF